MSIIKVIYWDKGISGRNETEKFSSVKNMRSTENFYKEYKHSIYKSEDKFQKRKPRNSTEAYICI